MGNVSDYFENIGYKSKYSIGDRVFGYWNKIPFIGTVGNDFQTSLVEGPKITIHLDLPIVFEGEQKTVILVKHKDIKRLQSLEDLEPLKLKEAGSIPAKRTTTRKK